MTRSAAACVAAGVFSAFLCAWGIGWRLPSSERMDFVIPARQRTQAWADKLAQGRASLYQSGFGLFFMKSTSDALNVDHAYSGFALRSGQEDERSILVSLGQINPRKLQFNPHFFIYGSFFLYTTGGVEWLASHLGLVKLVPSVAYYYLHPDEMAGIYRVGRWMDWGFAMSLLALVVWLAARLFDLEAAAWTLPLLAFSPSLIANAHILKPHMLCACLWTLSAAASLDLVRGGGDFRKTALKAATFAGLATAVLPGAGQTAMALFIPSFLLAPSARGSWSGLRFWLFLAACGTLAVGLYFLLTPYALLASGEWRAELTAYKNSLPPLSVGKAWLGTLSVPFRYGWGPAAWLSAFGAVPFLLWKGDRFERLMTLLFTANLLYMGALLGGALARSPEGGRGLLPYVVLFSLLSGRAARLALQTAAPRLRGALAAAFLALIAVHAGYGFLYASNFADDLSVDSNYGRAGAWINAHVPAGASVGLYSDLEAAQTPPFRLAEHPLASLTMTDPAVLRKDPPDYWIVSRHFDDPAWSMLCEGAGPRYELAERFDQAFIGRPVRDRLLQSNLPVYLYRRSAGGGTLPPCPRGLYEDRFDKLEGGTATR